jgi:hypothetical protein
MMTTQVSCAPFRGLMLYCEYNATIKWSEKALHDIQCQYAAVFPRSLLAMDAVLAQHKLIPAAKEAGVQLFVPSEYSLAWTREDAAMGIPLLQQKFAVEDDLDKHGLPYVHINTGGIAELFFNSP